MGVCKKCKWSGEIGDDGLHCPNCMSAKFSRALIKMREAIRLCKSSLDALDAARSAGLPNAVADAMDSVESACRVTSKTVVPTIDEEAENADQDW